MTYNILLTVKDPSIKRALRKAVSADGKLSFDEVKSVVYSALDGKGVTLREFKDLQSILKLANTIDQRSKMLIDSFLKKNYRPTVMYSSGTKITRSMSMRMRHFG